MSTSSKPFGISGVRRGMYLGAILVVLGIIRGAIVTGGRGGDSSAYGLPNAWQWLHTSILAPSTFTLKACPTIIRPQMSQFKALIPRGVSPTLNWLAAVKAL